MKMNELVIRGGKVLTNGSFQKLDILIEGEHIIAVEKKHCCWKGYRWREK